MHTDSTQNHTAIALLKRLARDHIRPYRKIIALAVISMIVASACTAANAYMMQPMLDEVFIEKDRSKLLIVPLIIISIALIGSVATYAHTLSMRYVGQRIISDMQVDLFAHLMKSDLTFFHEQAAGRLISRFTNDIQMMRNAVSQTLTALAKEMLTMIFLIGVMVHQSVELTLISFIVFPLAIYPVIRFGKRQRKLSHGTQRQLGDFTARLDEIFQGVRTVKAYNREEFEVTRASSFIESLFQLYFKAARLQAAASPMMELMSGVIIGAVVWYGGSAVLAGETTPGAFFSFITAFLMAYRPIKTMAGLNTTLQEGLASAHRLFEVMDIVPAIQDKPNATQLQLLRGAIRFEDVNFKYAANSAGVEHINIDVPAGKTVALVGLSGGGKSTLMNLLLRFYDVGSGRITVDGQDIRDVTVHSLRDHMAFVPQDIMLFDDTVRANIAYGRVGATDSEIMQAAQGAAAHEFISRLPEGYDTMIGPHGVKLSGGQRQRLAIARAMLRNAPILLLDEATSALDNESERSVQGALARLMEGRTTLVIAHRLSTIIHSDLIYVIERGHVVEAGSHDSLLAARGAYFRLYAENKLEEKSPLPMGEG